MSKVVINVCYGGFGLSEKAIDRFLELSGKSLNFDTIERDDPILVQVVEELGSNSFDLGTKLKVVEVPAGQLYRIDEYDGFESIETRDSIDWKVSK